MSERKIARIVALKAMGRRLAYEASGDVEKMMGEHLTQELGITDAPKKFFTAAKKKLNKALEEADMDLDLDDTDVYPYLQRAVLETADEMEMIK